MLFTVFHRLDSFAESAETARHDLERPIRQWGHTALGPGIAGNDEQVGVDGLRKLTCRKARCRPQAPFETSEKSVRTTRRRKLCVSIRGCTRSSGEHRALSTIFRAAELRKRRRLEQAPQTPRPPALSRARADSDLLQMCFSTGIVSWFAASRRCAWLSASPVVA
jgi:hypothetical protein